MIVGVEELLAMEEFNGKSKEKLQRKLDAIEGLIRAHTHNNFQNRHVQFAAASEGKRLLAGSQFLKAGDTVQISKSEVNDGIYTITETLDSIIVVDRGLYKVPCNLVTKVEYPADVQEGVINLLLWEIENRQKVGIKSETLSRHSVTYYDQDASNQEMGYPIALLGFLEPYMKARF